MGKVADLTHKVRASFSGNTLMARTLSGGAALLVGEAISSVIRLGANLIMTRLLYPEAFGVMLVINLVFSALAMLSDVGIRSAIIARKEELSDKFLHVAWTIMILRGGFLGVIAALIAQPIALWYGHPELFELVLVAAIAPVIAGFASPAPRVAERNVKLAWVTVWQVGTQALATVCTLTWLFIDPSIWALVAHGIFAAIIQVVLSFMMFPSGRIWFRWDNALAVELFHFGKWVLLGTALTFLGRQGDSLIVSQFLSFEALGGIQYRHFVRQADRDVGREAELGPAVSGVFRTQTQVSRCVCETDPPSQAGGVCHLLPGGDGACPGWTGPDPHTL